MYPLVSVDPLAAQAAYWRRLLVENGVSKVGGHAFTPLWRSWMQSVVEFPAQAIWLLPQTEWVVTTGVDEQLGSGPITVVSLGATFSFVHGQGGGEKASVWLDCKRPFRASDHRIVAVREAMVAQPEAAVMRTWLAGLVKHPELRQVVESTAEWRYTIRAEKPEDYPG